MTLNLVKKLYIDGEHGQLHCRVAGNLKSKQLPLVCLHMAPKSSRMFERMMPYLADERLVIAPDFPGHGESYHPAEKPHVTVEDYAESVYEVIQYFNLKKCGLIGYHTGSMVAVALTKKYPVLVEKLINISAPIYTQEEIAAYEEFFVPIPLDQEGNRYRIMWERILHYIADDVSLEIAAELMADNLRGGENYEWGHRAAFKHAKTYTENLGKIDQRLFVMNINDDQYEFSKRVDEYLKNGYRKDYPDFGYGFLDTKYQEGAQVMLDFFNGDA